MSTKKKVVVASEEEVARYASDGAAASAPASASQSAAAPADDQGAPAPAATEPRSEAEEWKEKFLRAKAELLNYQRRSEKEHQEGLRYANAGLVKALLPVMDDLERMIANGAEGGGNAQAIVDGAKLTLGNLGKLLASFSVVPIEAVGQPFNPQEHEAMMERPSEHPERVVLEQLTRGYRLHDRVLRPAKVIVSRPAREAGEKQEQRDAGEDPPA